MDRLSWPRFARASGQQDHYRGTPGRFLARREQDGWRQRHGEAAWRLLVLAYEGGYLEAQERAGRPA